MPVRFSLRHLLFAVTIAAFAVWSLSIGISRTQHNIEASRSTYAARLVAQMCVHHMAANNDSWPSNWRDLEDDFGPCLTRSGQSWSFDNLKERVGIDWDADLRDLSSKPDSNNIIWVAADPSFSFHGTNPTAIVRRYLGSNQRNNTK